MMQLDEQLFTLINREWATPSLDKLMAVMSSFALWGPVLAVIALTVLVFGGAKGRWLVVFLLVVVGLTEAIFINNLKKLVQRPRPREVLVNTRLVSLEKARLEIVTVLKPARVSSSSPAEIRDTGESFPSGHVTNNFATAAVLIAFFRWWGALYLLPATLVAYSRIYVGSHWPSDALASMLLGVLCALLILKIAQWILPKIGIAIVAFPGFSWRS